MGCCQGTRAKTVLESLIRRSFTRMSGVAPVAFATARQRVSRFTVDRICVGRRTGALSRTRVARPDLLVSGALLHAIGRVPGDPPSSSETGSTDRPRMARRSRYSIPVRWFASLAACRRRTTRASRRSATIDSVADAVAPSCYSPLQALTEADSLATGSSAWTLEAEWRGARRARVRMRLGVDDGSPLPTDRRSPFRLPNRAMMGPVRRRSMLRIADRGRKNADGTARLIVSRAVALHAIDVTAPGQQRRQAWRHRCSERCAAQVPTGSDHAISGVLVGRVALSAALRTARSPTREGRQQNRCWPIGGVRRRASSNALSSRGAPDSIGLLHRGRAPSPDGARLAPTYRP